MPGSSTSKPPAEPYPPDLGDDERSAELDDGIQDAVVDGADWAQPARPARPDQTRGAAHTWLTGAELGESAITDVVFADCRLDLAGLRNATLERVDLPRLPDGGMRLLRREAERRPLRALHAPPRDLLGRRRSARVELRGCDLAGLRGAEHLRGARLPFQDALENATLFATALGIELVD